MEKKLTLNQKAKQLVFMCAEAEELVLLKLHYGGVESKTEREYLQQTANNYKQKLNILRELLGQGPSSQSIADGLWSARTRYAEEHGLNKYVITGR